MFLTATGVAVTDSLPGRVASASHCFGQPLPRNHHGRNIKTRRDKEKVPQGRVPTTQSSTSICISPRLAPFLLLFRRSHLHNNSALDIPRSRHHLYGVPHSQRKSPVHGLILNPVTRSGRTVSLALQPPPRNILIG